MTVSRSTAEAEYTAMAVAVVELLWLSYLLQEVGLSTPPLTLLTDNISAQCLARNPIFHARTKHIKLDYHFIQELIEYGKLHLSFVNSKHQLADIFTKGLCYLHFLTLRSKLMCSSTGSHQLEGEM